MRSYPPNCFFMTNRECPLYNTGLEVDGGLCSACTDTFAIRGLKTQLITQLLITFHDEEKALEVFEKIRKCSSTW